MLAATAAFTPPTSPSATARQMTLVYDSPTTRTPPTPLVQVHPYFPPGHPYFTTSFSSFPSNIDALQEVAGTTNANDVVFKSVGEFLVVSLANKSRVEMNTTTLEEFSSFRQEMADFMFAQTQTNLRLERLEQANLALTQANLRFDQANLRFDQRLLHLEPAKTTHLLNCLDPAVTQVLRMQGYGLWDGIARYDPASLATLGQLHFARTPDLLVGLRRAANNPNTPALDSAFLVRMLNRVAKPSVTLGLVQFYLDHHRDRNNLAHPNIDLPFLLGAMQDPQYSGLASFGWETYFPQGSDQDIYNLFQAADRLRRGPVGRGGRGGGGGGRGGRGGG
ncbi:hypothetical protein P7C73_g3706, partial [Tremellales sp. Uapishka_1]